MSATDRATLVGLVLSLILGMFAAAAWMIARVDARIDRLDGRLTQRIVSLEDQTDEIGASVNYIRGWLERQDEATD